MSMDPGSQMNPAVPAASMQQPKSSKKLWIFGGLGCLGLIGLVCVGFLAVGYFYGVKPMQDFQTDNVTFAQSSPQVEEMLGTPVTVGQMVPEQSGAQSFTFSGPISGPNAKGTLVFKGHMEVTTWIRDEIYIEIDGEQTPLDEDSMFDLGLDDGSQ